MWSWENVSVHSIVKIMWADTYFTHSCMSECVLCPQGAGDRLSFRQKVDLLSQNATPIDQLFEVSATIMPAFGSLCNQFQLYCPNTTGRNIIFSTQTKSSLAKPKTVSQNWLRHHWALFFTDARTWSKILYWLRKMILFQNWKYIQMCMYICMCVSMYI